MQRLCLLVLFSLASLLLNHTALAEPYLIHKDGAMVLDKATGLVWMRCALWQTWDGKACAGKVARYSYRQALAASKSFNAVGLGGVTDWAMPTIRQLAGLQACSHGFRLKIVDLKDGGTPIVETCRAGSQNPTINSIVFPAFTDPQSFWSVSSVDSNADFAWVVNFSYGNVYSDVDYSFFGHAVRLVRAGQLLRGEAALGFVKQAPPAEAAWKLAK